MRTALTVFFRLLAKIFFRRIEIVGLGNVPLDRPVIYAANHPNGLVDPLFLLCFTPRPVSFLAKAPLFTMPVVGYFVRSLDSIPVYRKQDNVSGSTRETFARARAVLDRGGTIAIFPEGTTHSDPLLRELKTGAARIALSVGQPVSIVPTGIYYSAKQAFRSSALLVLAPPIEVTPAILDDQGEPAIDVVEHVTGWIDESLDAVTVQAESREALDVISRAENIYSAGNPDDVSDEFDLRRQFVRGYLYLRERDPKRLQLLQSRIARFEAELDEAGLEHDDLVRQAGGASVLTLIRTFVILVVLLPLAMIGAAIHFPVYRLIGMLAQRFAKGEFELIATIKILSALLLYPLLWNLMAIIIGIRYGPVYAVVVITALPLLGFLALRVFETLDDTLGRARAAFALLTRSARYLRIIEQQRAIRQELIEIGKQMG